MKEMQMKKLQGGVRGEHIVPVLPAKWKGGVQAQTKTPVHGSET